MKIDLISEIVLFSIMGQIGVFVVLGVLYGLLILFTFIFYRKEKEPAQFVSVPLKGIKSEIDKRKIAAISAALYQYLNQTYKVRLTKRKFSKNKSYEKLKIKRWKNG
ncbi:MAG: OadG family protein [Caldisericota bacterium]|nr:OadG family protein [Caldisericota bacterium]